MSINRRTTRDIKKAEDASKKRGRAPVGKELIYRSERIQPIRFQQTKLDKRSLTPQNALQLQGMIANHTLSQLLLSEKMQSHPAKRITFQTSNSFLPTNQRPVIQRTATRRALTVTPTEKDTLSTKMCHDAVAYCLMLAGVVTQDQYNGWGNTNVAAQEKLVDVMDTQAKKPQIPANTIVGVFRRQTQVGQWQLSHVMLSLGSGFAIGSNNGCIGGDTAWSVQNIQSQFTWPAGEGNPSYDRDNPDAPDWAKERLICYRTVGAAAAHF